jgi:penicillin V acylase-like amidase (Ntn superfamily)
MDFSIDIPANLWIFPHGMERSGQVGPNSLRWVSRYGSIAASSWDIATPDGMNYYKASQHYLKHCEPSRARSMAAEILVRIKDDS